jgi:3-phenylpropionate/trans-cinnamate dioxygenase ferredoxin reductase component
MATQDFAYAIIGGWCGGAPATEGIRGGDKTGSILLFSDEKHLPYHRPPLSKQLWLGKKKVEGIFFKDRKFYDDNGVTLMLSTRVVAIDAAGKTLCDDKGQTFRFGKLLLATGGRPRKLAIPGGALDGVCYFRYLDDYLATRTQAMQGKSAVVIGGGFIGSEIAAALNVNHVAVTMIVHGSGLCDRVFPAELGRALAERYRQHGIEVISLSHPTEIRRSGDRWLTRTQNGRQVESDLVIAGVGIEPAVSLAQAAGLRTENGIVVDECLRTSHPDIFAAGGNAFFPYAALGSSMRVEHWDTALPRGKQAGRNVAGAQEPFLYMPYFFSDLFEFGYEAVGEVDTHLETFADWEKENDTGVIYYLRDGAVRGAMMCNVWKKLDVAREMIRKAQRVGPRELTGAIR